MQPRSNEPTTCNQPRSTIPRPHQRHHTNTPRRPNGSRCHVTIQVHAETPEPIFPTNKHGRMLQLWKEGAFRAGMLPAKEGMGSMEKAIQSRRNHIRRRKPRERTVGKRQPLGIDLSNSHPREKPVAKEEEPPYKTRQLDTTEKKK